MPALALTGCRAASASLPPTPTARGASAAAGLDVEPAWTQPGGNGTVETLAWRPASQQFASGSSAGQVRLWSGAGQPVQTTQFPGFISGLSWSPDGATLAVATTTGTGQFWLGAGTLPPAFATAKDRYAAVAWRPTGGDLAVATGEGAVRLGPAGGTPGPALAVTGQTTALAWSPDGAMLVGGNRAGDVIAWTSTGHRRWLATASAATDVNDLAFSPDGQTLAVANQDGNVRLLTASDGHNRGTLAVGRPVNAVAWSPNGAALAVSSLRLSVEIWDATYRRLLGELPVGYDVNDVAWSPTGDLLVAGADDHALHAWSVAPPQGPGPSGYRADGYMAR